MQPHNCVVAYAIMGEAEKETVFAANSVVALNLKHGMEMRIKRAKEIYISTCTCLVHQRQPTGKGGSMRK
jgi:hypothetical protein